MVLPGGKPGCSSTHGDWCACPDHRWPTQPCVRGRRVDQGRHGPRAAACQPRGRHPSLRVRTLCASTAGLCSPGHRCQRLPLQIACHQASSTYRDRTRHFHEGRRCELKAGTTGDLWTTGSTRTIRPMSQRKGQLYLEHVRPNTICSCHYLGKSSKSP